LVQKPLEGSESDIFKVIFEPLQLAENVIDSLDESSREHANGFGFEATRSIEVYQGCL
jgi:hypothetical protein